jgi:hypothetical protein
MQGGVELVATTAHSRGASLDLNYGERSLREFVRGYGFVDSDSDREIFTLHGEEMGVHGGIAESTLTLDLQFCPDRTGAISTTACLVLLTGRSGMCSPLDSTLRVVCREIPEQPTGIPNNSERGRRGIITTKADTGKGSPQQWFGRRALDPEQDEIESVVDPLVQRIEATLAAFSTTETEDRSKLAQAESGCENSKRQTQQEMRRWLCLSYRVKRKGMLRYALEALKRRQLEGASLNHFLN